MCGICGIINFSDSEVLSSDIKSMMTSIKHRGPDDEGIFIENNVGLGFVRLSIIDLSQSGHQPMLSEDENYVIIFNGEIYNYIELRQELKNLGYSFRTNSDTEVLLKSYIEWKDNCLNKFNGMWSFVIYNRKNKEIFASVDRFGIKPFYYFVNNKMFIFGSEIKAILKILGKPSPDYENIFDYLIYNRTDHKDGTFFKEISKLKHGHNIKIKKNSVFLTKWYDLRLNLKEPFKDPDEYRETLSSAISLRLRSDVPLGVCLSGGLDSSSVVSTILKENIILNSFSAIYGQGKSGDETSYIFEYKDSPLVMHFTSPSANTFITDLEYFLAAHEEPVPTTSPYAQFKVMQLASKHVSVTLDGQGADEQLAGYHYFFGQHFKDLLLSTRLLELFSEQLNYYRIHKSMYGFKILLFYLLPQRLRESIRINENRFLADDFISEYRSKSTIDQLLYNSKSLNDSLLNHFEYKLEHLLKWEDRNSMFFSIEARVPFLDYRLVEKSLSLPSHDIIRKGNTKYILRQAMKGIVPEQIRLRSDKIGFSTPQEEWFKDELFKSFIYDILNSQSFKSRGIFDSSTAIKSFRNHLEGKVNISKEIWKWVNTELWFRKYIDN